MAKIVIIDDEAAILKLMTQLCEGLGHAVHATQSGTDGVDAIKTERPDLLIVDLRIGDKSGLEIIEMCANEYPGMPIIMVTGFGSIETAVEAMRLGAFDYLAKPFELDDLQRTVNRALKQLSIPKNEPQAATQPESIRPSSQLIGSSAGIQEILRIVEKIADNSSPVLLEGEFGSGKQIVARAIHDRSHRCNEPFKILHCSSLPENLLEAELFGGDGRQTIFNRAQGGTVVLEEINVLPMRLQSQLDSLLEEIGNQRLAGNLSANLDFRFIATSTDPLEKWVSEGKFREDLYYRVSVIPIPIPPLRKRQEDIALLSDHFLENYCKLTGTKKKEIDKYSLKMLTNYKWPGNVGELQNAIERACAFSDDNEQRIRPVDLPPKITQKIEITDEENEAFKHQLPIGSALSEYIKKQEKIFIRETLRFNEGSREKTASMLGVSIATLYRKMGLKVERDKMLNS
ncbi:MAG: sigma-54-dependent Fis family transcriptional regulator [Verrucomicrobiaceae bacterium]|nr:sigma-54-dependent Fis family transcriptional regulator [Verrucomicrobiaceae bacterium]